MPLRVDKGEPTNDTKRKCKQTMTDCTQATNKEKQSLGPTPGKCCKTEGPWLVGLTIMAKYDSRYYHYQRYPITILSLSRLQYHDTITISKSHSILIFVDLIL